MNSFIRIMKCMIIGFLLFTACVACQHKDVPAENAGQSVYETSLYEQYLEQLDGIDLITISNGTNGEKTTIDNPDLAALWLQNVQRLPIIVDAQAEIGVGFIYNVELFRNNELVTAFTNTGINNIATVDAHALVNAIESLLQRNAHEKES